MNTRPTCTLAVLSFLAWSSLAFCAVPLAVGPGTQYTRPDLSADGTRGIMSRVRWTCAGTGCTSTSDVVTFDLEACAQDVIRALTTEVATTTNARNGAIAGDGSTIAYIRSDSVAGTDTLITRPWPDGPEKVVDVVPATTPMGTPDLSFDGRYLALKIANTTLRVYDLQAATSRDVVTGTSIGTADHRIVALDGTVFYDKVHMGARRIFKCGPYGPCAEQLLPGPMPWGTEQWSATTSSDQSVYAFLSRNVLTGVTNAWAHSPELIPITSNVQSSALVTSLVCSWDCTHATLVSDSTMGSLNPASVQQVWLAPTIMLDPRRVTNLAASESDAKLRSVADGRGGVMAYSRYDCPLLCLSDADLNAGRVYWESYGGQSSITYSAADSLMKSPPFELATAATPTCTVSGSNVTCQVVLRNANESARGVVLVPKFHQPAGGGCVEETYTQQPSLAMVNVDTLGQATLTASFYSTCSTPSGTFTLHAVSPDVAQADTVMFTASF